MLRSTLRLIPRRVSRAAPIPIRSFGAVAARPSIRGLPPKRLVTRRSFAAAAAVAPPAAAENPNSPQFLCYVKDHPEHKKMFDAGLKSAKAAASPELDDKMARLVKAQEEFAKFDQAKTDKVFAAAALAANLHRLDLAILAVEDTGLGVVEDKVTKNHFASEFVFNKYRTAKSCGVISDDAVGGLSHFAEPLGIVAAIVPVTNPTSTIIFKALLALKSRNGIFFSPHPKAAKCSAATVKVLHDAAVAAGAPEGIIQCIEAPTIELTNKLIHHPSTDFILATGAGSMVKACYESGKPAIGVGAGNTPAVIDETADINMAVSSILLSKSFDNGMICASENSIIVVDQVYEQTKAEMKRRGAHFLTPEQKQKLGKLIFKDNKPNAGLVGRSVQQLAKIGGFEKEVAPEAVMLIAECNEIGPNEPFSYEKLFPSLALFRARDFQNACDMALTVVKQGGLGHTSCIHTNPNNQDRIKQFETMMPTARVLVDMPTTFGAIGDVYNFRLEPAMTLGCGTWGGNSYSGNVGLNQMLNVKQVAQRQENMLWFKVPKAIYFNRGSHVEAFNDLKGLRRAFIVTDHIMEENGSLAMVTQALDAINIRWSAYLKVLPDPTTEQLFEGVSMMNDFHPDIVIALGGGSPIDAAKAMRLLYEHPELSLKEMYCRFMDIRKRVIKFPNLGSKVKTVVAIPTTSGTAAEVTPFVVITDSATGRKYPIADYCLTPDMAVVDSLFVRSMPKGLTAHTGLDAVTHAIESYVSVCATDYTRGMSLQALKLLFKYLPTAYNNGADMEARERVHNASTIAGMAFANAFLGITHSLAHAVGSHHHVPHGLANALLLPHVIRYNATEQPFKRSVWSQYHEYRATQDYANIAKELGLCPHSATAAEGVEALLTGLVALSRSVGVPDKLRDVVKSAASFEPSIKAMAQEAFDDQCTPANPRYPIIRELEGILSSAFDTGMSGLLRPLTPK